MPSLLSILKTPIPGLKRRRPRVRNAPWILRRCPERLRPAAKLIFIFLGFWSVSILFYAALAAIVFLPLCVAHLMHPARPLATAPIHQLRDHFSHDTAFRLYLGICGFIFFVLVYASKVFDYLRVEGSRKER